MTADIEERLRQHKILLNGEFVVHPDCEEAAAEIERLRAVVRYALENGVGTQYHGEDDDCGTHSCCGEVSYKPHDPECWTVKARAALGEPT